MSIRYSALIYDICPIAIQLNAIYETLDASAVSHSMFAVVLVTLANGTRKTIGEPTGVVSATIGITSGSDANATGNVSVIIPVAAAGIKNDPAPTCIPGLITSWAEDNSTLFASAQLVALCPKRAYTNLLPTRQ